MSFKKTGYNFKIPKTITCICFFISGFFCCFYFESNSHKPEQITSLTKESLSICFTPDESCLPKIIETINTVNYNILVLGYSFTSKPIAQALIDAKNRGVSVRIILDHSQKSQKYSKNIVQALILAGIDVRFDNSVKIAHNKTLIVDGSKVVTGSYNWTHSAEFNNAENILFIQSPTIADQYTKYFETRWKISKHL